MIIFSHPKPFRPDTIPVQTLAFRSWRKAFPDARILLFGREEGTEKICWEVGLEYAGSVRVESKSGAALVSDIFSKVAKLQDSISLFLNSDIILGAEAGEVVKTLSSDPGSWLASGRRYSLPPFRPEFSENTENLRKSWHRFGRWGHKTALDYFLMKEMNFPEMPDFVLGHCAWDNWMFWHARMHRIRILDLSRDFPAYHFDHDYSYSLGNAKLSAPSGYLEERNLVLLGGEARRFHLGHATHEMKGGKILPRKGSAVLQREFELFRLRFSRFERPIKIMRQLLHPLIRAWEKITNRKEDWHIASWQTVQKKHKAWKSYRAKLVILSRRGAKNIGLPVKGPVQGFSGPPEGARLLSRDDVGEIRRSDPCLPFPHPYLVGKIQKYRETWVSHAKNLEIYGPTVAVVLNQHYLVQDVSIEWGQEPASNWIFRRQPLPQAVFLPGRSLVLASTGGETYFHWMTDVLPRIGLVKEAGYEMRSFDHVIVNQTNKPFQKETLALLGVPLERTRFFHGKLSAFKCEEAVLPSLPSVPGNVTNKTIRFLRALYPEPLPSQDRRIFIGRGSKGKRKVSEEMEIRRYLQSQKFEMYECGDLQVEEQARLFQSAETVVVAHGAAATNLVFCQPGTRVVELFGPNYVNPCYADLSSQAELLHSAVIGNGKDWKVRADFNFPDSPITASLELVKKVLAEPG